MTWNTTIGSVTTVADEIQMAYPWLNQLQYIFFIFACAISVALMVMIYSYLSNMNSVNECVLLHLYKDFVIILITSRIWMVIKVIVESSTITESQREVTMSQLSTKILSFTIFSLTNTVLMMLNIIGAIRLYMTKTMLLDPPMPWGNDDEFGIKIIRLIVGGISVGYPLILFPFEIYPKVYYDFVNQSHPRSASLFAFPCILQVVVFLTIMLVYKYYQKKEVQQTSSNIPHQVNYFVFVNALLYGFILFELSFQLLNPDTRWTIIQILVSLLAVTTPLAVILTSEKLSTFSIKFLKEKYEDAFILSIYIVPVMLSFCMYCSLHVLYWILNI